MSFRKTSEHFIIYWKMGANGPHATFHTGGRTCAGPVHTPGHTFPSRLPVVGTACTCLTDGETEADKYNLPQVTQLISGQARHGWGGSGARIKPPRRVPPGPRRLRRSALWGPGTIPLAFCKVLPKTNHLTAPAWASIF